jgi:hypothetical protein
VENGLFAVFPHSLPTLPYTQCTSIWKKKKAFSEVLGPQKFFHAQNVRRIGKKWKEILVAPASIQTTVML